MLKISKEANPNYLCKVVGLKNLQKHSNADRLQTVSIDFQTVITGLDAKDGDIYIYFPIECKINHDFLSQTNSYRENTLNKDPKKTGFFEDNRRVKAMKLRGEQSMGYIVPASEVYKWAKVGNPQPDKNINLEFDTINGIKLVEKYIPKIKGTNGNGKNQSDKKPQVSRLIDGQVQFHIDTNQLRKNSHKINPEDTISITYKTHGTSWWVSNVLVKRNLSYPERLLKWMNVNITTTEYDLIYGSRRVVKNKSMNDPKVKDHFYSYDLWEDIKNNIGSLIPKGYTLYGEMLGYDKNGGIIQKGFDYGCKQGEHKLEVYRITNTTPDGLVTELSYPEIHEFCTNVGLTPSHLFFYGKAKDLFDIQIDEKWHENFINKLAEKYNEKDCFMCKVKAPEEGVVVRKESLFRCESYKLKSFRFLEKESKILDSGESDIESEN